MLHDSQSRWKTGNYLTDAHISLTTDSRQDRCTTKSLSRSMKNKQDSGMKA